MDTRTHTTKAEWFYLAYVLSVGVLPILLAYDQRLLSLLTTILASLCGFASAIEALDGEDDAPQTI